MSEEVRIIVSAILVFVIFYIDDIENLFVKIGLVLNERQKESKKLRREIESEDMTLDSYLKTLLDVSAKREARKKEEVSKMGSDYPCIKVKITIPSFAKPDEKIYIIGSELLSANPN